MPFKNNILRFLQACAILLVVDLKQDPLTCSFSVFSIRSKAESTE
jgi:hypothetical protein